MFVVSSFYRFARFTDFREWKPALENLCRENGVLGTVLLAEEGINGTVSGPKEGVDVVIDFIKSDPRFANLETKEAESEDHPFGRLRIRLKREIISIRNPLADPDKRVGTYVAPDKWNDLITQPDIVVLDTRNDYEVEEGTFRGALKPQIKAFGQFPDFVNSNLDPAVHKKIAMFCTGGIRCEKASALMLSLGFQEVYHLQGGILSYLQQVPPESNLFEGSCFVFDGRETVST